MKNQRIYYAVNKKTKELFQGTKGKIGFLKIGHLKSSITNHNNYYWREGKRYNEYDFYCVDIKNMKIQQIDMEE